MWIPSKSLTGCKVKTSLPSHSQWALVIVKKRKPIVWILIKKDIQYSLYKIHYFINKCVFIIDALSICKLF